MSLLKHESSGGTKTLSVLFCSTFHSSVPKCSTASTYPMPHLYRREELELASAQICFHGQIPSAQRYTASQWEGWRQSSTPFSAGSEPWALTSRQDFLPSGPVGCACADRLLRLQLSFNSGTACFNATQQLDPQQTRKS